MLLSNVRINVCRRWAEQWLVDGTLGVDPLIHIHSIIDGDGTFGGDCKLDHAAAGTVANYTSLGSAPPEQSLLQNKKL